MNPDTNNNEKGASGAMISIVVIALVIIAGAYYSLRRIPSSPSTQDAQVQTDPTTAAFSQQSASDAVADIQKDINATPDTSKIGAGLGSMPL